MEMQEVEELLRHQVSRPTPHRKATLATTVRRKAIQGIMGTQDTVAILLATLLTLKEHMDIHLVATAAIHQVPRQTPAKNPKPAAAAAATATVAATAPVPAAAGAKALTAGVQVGAANEVASEVGSGAPNESVSRVPDLEKSPVSEVVRRVGRETARRSVGGALAVRAEAEAEAVAKRFRRADVASVLVASECAERRLLSQRPNLL